MKEPYNPTRAFLWSLLVLMFFACIILAGCKTAAPVLPKTVTVVVEKAKPIPAWAARELAVPQRKDGTVEALVVSHEARGRAIELANCRTRLLVELYMGREIDEGACGVDP